MASRIRLLEEIPVGHARPTALLDIALDTHGKSRVGSNTQLARNDDGSFSLLLYGRCICRFTEDYVELRTYGFRSPTLADRLRTVLALWETELLTPAGNSLEIGWQVRRGEQTCRLMEGTRVPYKGSLLAHSGSTGSGTTERAGTGR